MPEKLSVSTRTDSWLRSLAVHAALLVAFLLLSRLSSVFQTTELRTSPWNPETGLAVLAGLFWGRPAVVTIAVGIFISTRLWGWALPGLWEYISVVVRTLIFAGTATMVAPYLLRDVEPTLQAVLTMFTYAMAITVAYALARLILLWASVGIEPEYLLPYTATLSVGNLVGILTLIPVFMSPHPLRQIATYVRSWTLFHWTSIAALTMVAFFVFGIREINQFKFFYLIFLPVIAFAVRDGFLAAAISVLFSDVLMLGILYWREFESSTATELQFLMLSLSTTGLLLGTAVSDRKRAVQQLNVSHLHLQETQSALLQASRLSLASEMAAAMAHEFNQPLSSVRNYVRAIQRRLETGRFDTKAMRRDIDAAVLQVDNAAALLRSTRRFLERGSAQREAEVVETILRESVALVRPELQKDRIRIDIALDLDPPLAQIVCNKPQIQQVLLNLVRNAKEALIGHGEFHRRIVISATLATRPGHVEIAVSDNGPGVSAELRALLFKPLQSSKPEGLGLGLSLCSTIVRGHGGDFWLDEATTKGAKFVFTLPIFPNQEI